MKISNISRRGNVLVLSVLLWVGLLGIMALVLDLGRVRCCLQEMQPIADAAALEALRTSDQAAIDLATQAQLAAGSRQEVAFDAGIGLEGTDYRASQLLSLVPTEITPLRANSTSPDPGGDILHGNAAWTPSTRHREGDDYSRDDFQQGLAPDDAVLIRLRYTGEREATATRSSRPRLPYLFARGTLLSPDSKASGIAVRTSAIAAVRIHPMDATGIPGAPVEVGRVKSVGPHIVVGTGSEATWCPGVFPFAILSEAWASLPLDTESDIRIVGDSLLRDTAVIGSNGEAAFSLGQPLKPFSDYNLVLLKDRIPLSESHLYGYVTIVKDRHVLGYGFADLPRSAVTSSQFRLIKRRSRIARVNASAALIQPIPAEIDPVALLRSHATDLSESLLVPVLVRSTGPTR